jgi:hypothetical protein
MKKLLSDRGVFWRKNAEIAGWNPLHVGTQDIWFGK